MSRVWGCGPFPERLDLLQELCGTDGPFGTVTIRGREHVVVANPSK